MPNNTNTINYSDLFDIWVDFDEDESNTKVKKLVVKHSLRKYDAMSFMGFCYGYEMAMKLSGEKNA